eukprot:GHVS01080580.1.p1 GENE.GHVS01080580.1~~GHVS01080580.1.p1  ORF type:complete len:1157 (+),score=368.38 GHVS01080580.1:139-3609(+)
MVSPSTPPPTYHHHSSSSSPQAFVSFVDLLNRFTPSSTSCSDRRPTLPSFLSTLSSLEPSLVFTRQHCLSSSCHHIPPPSTVSPIYLRDRISALLRSEEEEADKVAGCAAALVWLQAVNRGQPKKGRRGEKEEKEGGGVCSSSDLLAKTSCKSKGGGEEQEENLWRLGLLEASLEGLVTLCLRIVANEGLSLYVHCSAAAVLCKACSLILSYPNTLAKVHLALIGRILLSLLTQAKQQANHKQHWQLWKAEVIPLVCVALFSPAAEPCLRSRADLPLKEVLTMLAYDTTDVFAAEVGRICLARLSWLPTGSSSPWRGDGLVGVAQQPKQSLCATMLKEALSDCSAIIDHYAPSSSPAPTTTTASSLLLCRLLRGLELVEALLRFGGSSGPPTLACGGKIGGLGGVGGDRVVLVDCRRVVGLVQRVVDAARKAMKSSLEANWEEKEKKKEEEDEEGKEGKQKRRKTNDDLEEDDGNDDDDGGSDEEEEDTEEEDEEKEEDASGAAGDFLVGESTTLSGWSDVLNAALSLFEATVDVLGSDGVAQASKPFVEVLRKLFSLPVSETAVLEWLLVSSSLELLLSTISARAPFLLSSGIAQDALQAATRWLRAAVEKPTLLAPLLKVANTGGCLTLREGFGEEDLGGAAGNSGVEELTKWMGERNRSRQKRRKGGSIYSNVWRRNNAYSSSRVGRGRLGALLGVRTACLGSWQDRSLLESCWTNVCNILCSLVTEYSVMPADQARLDELMLRVLSLGVTAPAAFPVLGIVSTSSTSLAASASLMEASLSGGRGSRPFSLMSSCEAAVLRLLPTANRQTLPSLNGLLRTLRATLADSSRVPVATAPGVAFFEAYNSSMQTYLANAELFKASLPPLRPPQVPSFSWLTEGGGPSAHLPPTAVGQPMFNAASVHHYQDSYQQLPGHRRHLGAVPPPSPPPQWNVASSPVLDVARMLVEQEVYDGGGGERQADENLPAATSSSMWGSLQAEQQVVAGKGVVEQREEEDAAAAANPSGFPFAPSPPPGASLSQHLCFDYAATLEHAAATNWHDGESDSPPDEEEEEGVPAGGEMEEEDEEEDFEDDEQMEGDFDQAEVEGGEEDVAAAQVGADDIIEVDVDESEEEMTPEGREAYLEQLREEEDEEEEDEEEEDDEEDEKEKEVGQ